MPLDKFRNRIDQIDKQLVELLNERAKVVVDIGQGYLMDDYVMEKLIA
jgi:chorismate mutase